MAITPNTNPNTTHLTHKGEQTYAGTHLIIDLHNARHLDDQLLIEQALRDATEATGATLLHIHSHRFSPQGVTAMAILAESHISCHTWPEINYAAFDIFMCGDTDPHAALPVLKAAFETEDIQVTELHRGHLPA
ncbi:adenosylmethionine decarboxylase [Rhodobacteraceae bacterium N5(2021)]|uniref:S-adenosylmethionine decarboxylase proenzyme n=1 Tax=Gymnodinialimonas phycosphaerae TaxID=2841589 RepID=A0A975TYJ3_9RHOB|nr:adenosylmethionine decarboxylase [Gymnodinialimonas phycosphaerae]MBY4892278.1 adenosylmethionine decarboxylase [Gymnodinialimonas phycosphaerae]